MNATERAISARTSVGLPERDNDSAQGTDRAAGRYQVDAEAVAREILFKLRMIRRSRRAMLAEIAEDPTCQAASYARNSKPGTRQVVQSGRSVAQLVEARRVALRSVRAAQGLPRRPPGRTPIGVSAEPVAATASLASVDTVGRQGDEQLVVLAAAPWPARGRPCPRPPPRSPTPSWRGSRSSSITEPHAARRGQVARVAAEAVAEVDHRGRPRRSQGPPRFQAGLGLELAAAQRVGDQRRPTALRELGALQEQRAPPPPRRARRSPPATSPGRAPERGTSSSAERGVADDGDPERKRRGAGHVAAEHGHTVLARRPRARPDRRARAQPASSRSSGTPSWT